MKMLKFIASTAVKAVWEDPFFCNEKARRGLKPQQPHQHPDLYPIQHLWRPQWPRHRESVRLNRVLFPNRPPFTTLRE